MDPYVTGGTIRALREARKMTQTELAERLAVSDKTVSKWETGRGYPDITLLQPLSAALNTSVIELLSGNTVSNLNRAGNLKRSRFYLCPLCGNVLWSCGEAVVSCCGLTLPPLEAEECDGEHGILTENVEDEYYVRVEHPMSREHHISFLAAVSDCGAELRRFYGEEDCAARFKRERTEKLYACCNRHGLFSIKAGR